MNETESDILGFNRRNFLKGGSVATLMTMLGGVELFAEANNTTTETKNATTTVRVGVIGLGAWGREILDNLALLPQADVAAICDNYPAFLKRSGSAAPKAKPHSDYKELLADKDIKAVIIATPTHLHKDIALAALKAGKHVYCEAPLANTREDAREIALAAKALPKHQIFQPGLQLRSDPERNFLLPFIRSGAIGQPVMARAQWHKRQSWRASAANPEREKAMNWRLKKETSLGLIGEIGMHQIDQANWFLKSHPIAVTGFGSIRRWSEDGRDVPDTVQAIFEYPGGVNLIYDATLANSFDADYEIYYGTDSAVMIRANRAWMFKEADAPQLGWEVYASKEVFYKETGIALVANASKSVKTDKPPEAADEIKAKPLFTALQTFVTNASDTEYAVAEAQKAFPDDPAAVAEQVASSVKLLSNAAHYLEGFQANVLAIKANEAIMTGKRIELKPDWYELT
jgi:predicted dehydrogenase